MIVDRMQTRRAAFVDRLWAVASDARTDRKQKLRAACALASLDPHGGRWEQLAGDVAGSLVVESASRLERWLDALRPARKVLLEPLAVVFRDRARPDTERSIATGILEQYANDDPQFLVKLIKDANVRQFATLLPVLKPHRVDVIDLLSAELDDAAGSRDVGGSQGQPRESEGQLRGRPAPPGRACGGLAVAQALA